MSQLKRTPLYPFHVAHGGRLVDFAGWEMPVQYKSILEEHKAVRCAAGLFDVSHMGEIDVRGPQALAFLQTLVTNDLSAMTDGRVVYSPMCYENGGVVDDLLVYRRGEGDYFLCVNASNIEKDLEWMRSVAAKFDVALVDRSDETALVALQGPKAAEILQSVCANDLGALKYYHFTTGTVAGVSCVISRTGYTGEDGFELYHASADAQRLAEALLTAGTPHGLQLAGLGARDSLRLEAGYPLYGHELSADISPLTAGLAWTVKLDKGVEFIGAAALRREKQSVFARKVIFFRTGDRRIVRAGTQVLNGDDQTVGSVVSGTLSPILNEAIGSALVGATASTKYMQVEIRGEKLPLRLVKPPFVELKKIP
ncbi:glycine cleavage system aminomethyltransferase GcvT [Nibricoccus sp. IMCC34717]|uniref:glycine cleavage system aminomethyltransferase GcvT n=1 Tax=Nibricoccus sp. IMCC34717 TaxID=3034021 RepID=UPI00385041D5